MQDTPGNFYCFLQNNSSLLNSINSHFSFSLSNINWINIQLAGALKQNKFVVNPPFISIADVQSETFPILLNL